MHLEPFRIAVPDAVLADLRERLARTRFPDEIPDSGWTYGTNLAYLRELVAYWRERFDWRAAEARLNALPQFRARVGGLGIHFIHVRGRSPIRRATGAIPPTPSTWWRRRCRATASPITRASPAWTPSASPRCGPS